jgi:hypothetical protein
MKKNITLTKIEKDFDFFDLIILFCKEKIIFFTIIFLTTFFSLLFVLIFSNEYQALVRLKDPSAQLFSRYDLFDNFPQSDKITDLNNEKIEYSFINEYKIEFQRKLTSVDNLSDYLKKFQIEKSIRVRQLFTNKKLSNDYVLVYPKEINGEDIFNDYVEFTKFKTLDEFKDKIKLIIENEIIKNENAIKIAEKIGIEIPIQSNLQSPIKTNDKSKLFYQGTIALNQQIVFYRELIEILQKEKFDYNIFIDKATKKGPLISTKSKFIYIFGGFAFGLFLSFIIVFIKSSLKIKRSF